MSGVYKRTNELVNNSEYIQTYTDNLIFFVLLIPRTSFKGLNHGSQSWMNRSVHRGITLVNFRIRVEMHRWKNKNCIVSRVTRTLETKESGGFTNTSVISNSTSKHVSKNNNRYFVKP